VGEQALILSLRSKLLEVYSLLLNPAAPDENCSPREPDSRFRPIEGNTRRGRLACRAASFERRVIPRYIHAPERFEAQRQDQLTLIFHHVIMSSSSERE
jgi:hypothetical protein